MPNIRPCPVEDCQELLLPGHLVCKPHWFKLPQIMRLAVRKTWDLYKTTTDNAEKRAAYAKWREKSREAITWLNNLGVRPNV